jgi:hypothetical protein
MIYHAVITAYDVSDLTTPLRILRTLCDLYDYTVIIQIMAKIGTKMMNYVTSMNECSVYQYGVSDQNTTHQIDGRNYIFRSVL